MFLLEGEQRAFKNNLLIRSRHHRNLSVASTSEERKECSVGSKRKDHFKSWNEREKRKREFWATTEERAARRARIIVVAILEREELDFVRKCIYIFLDKVVLLSPSLLCCCYYFIHSERSLRHQMQQKNIWCNRLSLTVTNTYVYRLPIYLSTKNLYLFFFVVVFVFFHSLFLLLANLF